MIRKERLLLFPIILLIGTIAMYSLYASKIRNSILYEDEEVPNLNIDSFLNQTYFENVSSPDLDFFTDSNNETGYTDYIVPNIVHFIRINQTYLSFYEYINLKAVYLNQRPDKITIHCDMCDFHGKYWDMIKNLDVLEVRQVVPPSEVFGRQFSNIWHRSDVLRIQIMREFGGIILDNDVYVVQSLDHLRKFEMVIGWDESSFTGIQTMIGHKNARFLKFYFESYKFYRGERWYYNSGILPTKSILWKHPEFVHRIKRRFGVHTKIVYDLYDKYWSDWEKQLTIHLFIRHRPTNVPTEFNEVNIGQLKNTYGAMARLIYYGSKNLTINN